MIRKLRIVLQKQWQETMLKYGANIVNITKRTL